MFTQKWLDDKTKYNFEWYIIQLDIKFSVFAEIYFYFFLCSSIGHTRDKTLYMCLYNNKCFDIIITTYSMDNALEAEVIGKKKCRNQTLS